MSTAEEPEATLDPQPGEPPQATEPQPPEPAEPAEPAEPVTPPHPPTRARTGAIYSFCALVSILWLVSYTLFDWDWQQSLGGWNWLIVVAFATVFSQGLQHWHTGE